MLRNKISVVRKVGSFLYIVKRRIQVWEEKHPFFRAKPQTKGYVVIKILTDWNLI